MGAADSIEAGQAVHTAREATIHKLGVLREAATGAIAVHGGRLGPGDRALVHVQDALAVMKVINRNSNGQAPGEVLQELQMVERCLVRASRELDMDYDQL